MLHILVITKWISRFAVDQWHIISIFKACAPCYLYLYPHTNPILPHPTTTPPLYLPFRQAMVWLTTRTNGSKPRCSIIKSKAAKLVIPAPLLRQLRVLLLLVHQRWVRISTFHHHNPLPRRRQCRHPVHILLLHPRLRQLLLQRLLRTRHQSP